MNKKDIKIALEKQIPKKVKAIELKERREVMDIEKAIDILNDPEADMVYTVEEIDLACLVAIDALKKQLPQKGIPYNSAKNHNFVECGACNKDMGMYYQYCPKCGQKSDWI